LRQSRCRGTPVRTAAARDRGAMPIRPRSPPPERLRSVSLPYPGLSLRVNRETRRGRPARIVLGDPIPEMVNLLPEPSELGA
jgi:hypothetical protein